MIRTKMLLLTLLTAAALASPMARAADAAKPLAESDGQAAGSRIELNSMTRTGGDTVTVKLTLINDGTKELDTYNLLVGDHGKMATVDGLELVDPAAKKSYHVIRDAHGSCLCSQNLTGIAPGARVNLWAKFPAPPAKVKAVSLVVPRFAPMDDLKLEP